MEQETVDHSLTCQVDGYTSVTHNSVRDSKLTASEKRLIRRSCRQHISTNH